MTNKTQTEAQEPLAWTPGPNLFKDWCAQWFGPDSDDEYLAKAVFNLPPMAQVFKDTAPQQEAQEPVVAAVFDEQLGRPMLVEGAPMLSHGQPLFTAPQPVPQEPVATVVECGNLYAKVKLSGEAFGTTKVGDRLYKAQQP